MKFQPVLFVRLILESFLFALEALRVNKLRTLLSLLGITIGIFAIISVFTVTDALERKIRTDVESLGNNVVYIQKWPWVPEGGDEYPWWKYMNRPVPGYKEMLELQRKSGSAEAIAFVASVNGQTIKSGSNSVENAIILPVSHNYDRIKKFEIEEGRYFSEHESNSGKPIALIGSDISNALFAGRSALGQLISVRGIKFTIIGVLKKEGSSLVGNSSDNNVLIPVNYARNLFNVRSESMDPYLMVKAREGVGMPELRDDLKSSMRSIRKLKPREEDDFALNETSLLTRSMQQIFSMLGLAGWIIGGFSILVGGFGIANIMFVSVKERTPIIGIQKSLGAKNYFILLQFLVESIILCLIGGLIGLALVYLLATGASKAFDFDLDLTLGNILTGLMISASVGILSGYVPAYQASRMNPVDAIRAA